MTDTFVTLNDTQRIGLRDAVELASVHASRTDVSVDELRAEGTRAFVLADLLELAEGGREQLSDRGVPFLREQCAETLNHIAGERKQLWELEDADDPARRLPPGETREEAIASRVRGIAGAQREVEACQTLLAQLAPAR
jgi:hypothetical protein